MTRVATLPLQNTLATAMQRAQEKLADSNLQLDTGSKVQDYASLGTDTGRVLSAATMLSQQQAQSAVAKRVGTTLSMYDTSLTAIDDSASALKTKLLNAIGTGDSPDLDSAIQSSFNDVRNALNTTEAGVPIFGGGQVSGQPFVPQTLSDLSSMNPSDAFANDDTRSSARLGDNIDVQYGVGASDIGTGLVQAFKTLSTLGPFGDKLTDAQVDGIKTAMSQIDDGLSGVRAVNAKNGDNENQVETLGKRADDRATLLTGVIGDAEDADMGQVATDISTRTNILNASYAAFSKLNGLSLINYLQP